MTRTVGIVGVGNMGSALAGLLLKVGYRVVAFDIDEVRMDAHVKAGGLAAGSPKDVADQAEFIITSLPSAEAFHAVAFYPDGIGACTKAGRIVAETSTLAIADKLKGRDALATAGIIMLDCPLSGTEYQAREKQIAVYASGDRAAYERFKPVFESMSASHAYVGEFGQGSKMKFVANLLVIVHTCAAAEAMAFAIKAGLDPAQVHSLIAQGAGTSRMWEVRGRFMVDRKYPQNVAYDMARKDGRIIADVAADLQMPLPLFHAALEPFWQAISQGFHGTDPASLCEVFLKNAGVDQR